MFPFFFTLIFGRYMKLSRTFFSLYFLIISTFIIFSWLLDEVWSTYLEKDIESYTGYKTMLAAVGDFLQKHPQDEWDDIIAKVGEKYNLPLTITTSERALNNELIHTNSFSHGNTHVYYDDGQVIIHYLIENSNVILSLGPVKMPIMPRNESILRIMILAMLALVIYIWVWPMSRDLDLLKKATVSFGKGEFDSQAPLAKTAMIAPMVNAFNMMAERTKRLIEAHKELSSAVSHELRTPLARTKFALQMLNTVKDENKREKYLQQINNDVNELDGLINEMLIYAAFDSDKPNLIFEGVGIADLVQGLLPQYEQFSGRLTVNNQVGDLIVDCDAHFISRALNNYITNAIKYGKDIISITIAKKNKCCVLTVEDNGSGVSAEFKSIIFDAFSRGDQSRNKETGGFGLGLAIVNRIMEWHQGSVAINDSELGGAAFELSWPIKRI
jgi:two-component system, OmpR family, sensor kinase